MNTFNALLDEVSHWPKSEGVRVSDLLSLSEPLRAALNTVIREGSVPFSFFAEALALDAAQTHALVERLLDHGFLKTAQTGANGEIEYRLWHAQALRRSKGLNVWSKVMGDLPPEPQD